MVSLTRSGGVILISVRNTPFDDVRTFKSTTVYDIECLAREHGLVVGRVACVRDQMGRGDVSWDCVALRLPHDGTDALPLLRHVILNDSKSTTYKLALLRSLCRAAELTAGMAAEAEDDHVAVPLGLVALFWMRLYAPLLAANLPQSPQNERQGKALGFVNDAFAAILRGRIPVNDSRVGAAFWGDDSVIVHEAIRLSAQTIRKNPATYTTYSDGTQIFPCVAGRPAMPREPLIIDTHYLELFGSLRVPRDVWRAMQRFASWIEPSIVAEWMRIMKGYARNMNGNSTRPPLPQPRHGPSQIATWTPPVVAHWRYWTAPRSTASGAAKGWTPRRSTSITPSHGRRGRAATCGTSFRRTGR